MTMKWFKLKGFIITKSSEKFYHVIFDCAVSWSEYAYSGVGSSLVS